MENNEKEIDLMGLVKTVLSKKRKLIKWGLVGLMAGAAIAFSLPKEYQSVLKIAPETKAQGGSAGQLSGFAAMMGVNIGGASGSGIDESLYPEIVKSGPFVAEFSTIKVPFDNGEITLEEYLTKEQKSPWWSCVFGAPMQFAGWIFAGNEQEEKELRPENVKNPSDVRRAFEGALSRRIKVQTDKKSGLISMEVKMQDPTISLIVADSLFEKLSRYMSDYHTAKARYDLNNSQGMLAQAKVQYYKADSDYALVVDQNQNLISKSAQIKVDRFKNERDLAYMVYQQLAQQVESNKMLLQQNTPIATVIEPARVPNTPVSPNKKLIILAMTFLGVFAAAVSVILKKLVA